MNKHIVSIMLLMSILPAAIIGAVREWELVWPGGHVLKTDAVPNVNWECNFTVKTNLTMSPKNYEQWELVRHEGLKLISYQFMASDLVGSAGSQEWVFKPQSSGFHHIIFTRDGGLETFEVTVYAYSNYGYDGWCGTADMMNKRMPAVITF